MSNWRFAERSKQASSSSTILLAYAEGKPAQNLNVSGGLLHAHAWRPLATLTDEEVQQLAAIRKRLSGPEADTPQTTIDLTASTEAAEVFVEH